RIGILDSVKYRFDLVLRARSQGLAGGLCRILSETLIARRRRHGRLFTSKVAHDTAAGSDGAPSRGDMTQIRLPDFDERPKASADACKAESALLRSATAMV